MTRSLLGKALLVSQVALSLLLLVGAGLFVRTLVNLQRVDTGFNQDHVLLFQIDSDSIGYKEDSRLVKLYKDAEEKVSLIPGVRAASFSMFAFNQGDGPLLRRRAATLRPPTPSNAYDTTA